MKAIKLFAFLLIFIILAGCQSGSSSSQVATPTTAPPPTEAIPPTDEPPAEIKEGSILLTGGGEEVTITKIVEITSQVRWAVGSRTSGPNMVLYSTDGSQSWADRTPQDSTLDPTRRHQAITSFLDKNTGWVIFTGSNLVWTTHDAGATWQAAALDVTNTFGGLIYSLNKDTCWIMLFSDVAGAGNADTTLYRTLDGGSSWELMLHPSTDPSHVQSFTKTGLSFGSPEYGWVTRDSYGIIINPYLDITRDGGKIWESLSFPPPEAYPDLFMDCGCGLYNPNVSAPGVGSFRMSCNCLGDESYQYTVFDYQTFDEGGIWIIYAIEE